MIVEISEKILIELKKLNRNNLVRFKEQDELFWYFTVHCEKDKKEYRVHKFFVEHQDGFYHFKTYKLSNNNLWEEYIEVIVQTEFSEDNSDDFWKDPEPIRPFSLQGLRIKLHHAYNITKSIHESFYLVSNEIYQTTLNMISYFEEKKEDKHHENVLSYNMMKLFQAFEVFKEDLNAKNDFIKDTIFQASRVSAQ